MSLRITVVTSSGPGFSFPEADAIDFIPRKKGLPKSLLDHGLCPDNFLVNTPFEKLKKLFLGVDSDDEGDDDSPPETEKKEDDAAAKKKAAAKKAAGKKEAAKTEDSGQPVAADYNLSVGDDVHWQGDLYEIARISGDGTALVLVDADENIQKAIGPDEVVKHSGDDTAPFNEEKEEKGDYPEHDPEPHEEEETPNEKEGEGDWDEAW
jgi:hypothetical protein